MGHPASLKLILRTHYLNAQTVVLVVAEAVGMARENFRKPLTPLLPVKFNIQAISSDQAWSLLPSCTSGASPQQRSAAPRRDGKASSQDFPLPYSGAGRAVV